MPLDFVSWTFQLAIISKAARFRLIQLLNRFVPVVARGVGLGFAIVAMTTLLFGMGEYSEPRERYVFTGIFGFIAVVSFGLSRAIKPILKWILRRA